MEAVVTFEYEAQQDDELDLKVGEVIKDVQNVDEGWCEGTLYGKRGMFPDNFVQIREPSKPPPDAAPQIRAMSQSKKTRRAKVSFSYAADNIDELSLEPGQIVEVLAEEEEGWWRGKMGGKEGVFPSNFVEIIEEGVEPSQPAAPAVTSQPPPPQQSAPPPRPPSPGESAPPEPAVPKHVMGQPVMPKFDPSQALAKLKKSTNAEPKKPAAAPPASSVSRPPPPATVKAPPPDMPQSSSSKVVEKAKVTFEYDADNADELTIRVGEIVEIVNKNTDNDGWWEVRLGDRIGLIPDNFVDILPASPPSVRRPSASTRTTQPPPPQPQPEPKVKAPIIPSKPPGPALLKKKPAPEPGKKPPKLEPHPPPPMAPPTASTLTTDKDPSDFGVPSTQPLDSSAVKNRPKKTSRPPSRSNLLQGMEDEGINETPPEPAPTPAAAAPPPEKPSPAPTPDKPAAAPWQRELKEKKKKAPLPKPAPKTPLAPKPTTPSKPPITASPAKPAVSRPEPPKVHVEPKPSPSTAASLPKEPTAIPSLRRSDTPPVPAAAASSTATPPPASAPPTASNNEWKEAFENLRDEFEKFKKFVMAEIQTLTDDLDKEIKHRAALEVDIGRLKKSRGFPH